MNKTPCPDCTFCQRCSDERCRLCLISDNRPRRKLSLEEQIALFESLNPAAPTPDTDATA